MTLPREHMVEYLYGELKGEELRAFEQQLRESDDARGELAALQATLGSAREGLAHTADEAPPERVRRAVLAAAIAHAPRRSVAPRWLRTSFLVVPALAVAAAALLVVLDQNLEAPRVHINQPDAQSPLEPSPPPPSAAAPPSGFAQPPSAAAPPSGPAPVPSAAATHAEARRAREQSARAPDARSADTPFAQPPAAWRRERPPPSAAKRRPADALLDTPSKPAQSAPAAPAPAAQEPREGREPAESLAPPPAREAKAASGAVPNPRGAAAEPEAEHASGASPTRGAAAKRPSADTFPASTSALERRAHDHMIAKRWRRAAADYRELLRREPASKHAAEWKKQLALAAQALQTSAR